ncbi:MAG: protein-L-isoaspartate(D-aspartate) O-methyltransferase [Nitrospirae bacterium]|nr:protein-L-isoaspartate(D-aspartate) O-methyltransferase [Nitrospirota bacterium]
MNTNRAERQAERDRMVEEQLVARGIRDTRVLAAMRKVPRHRFLDPLYEGRAYDDHALPIGEGQTISQPYMVALMTDLLDLRPEDRVLEIGTGSGYQTAVLAELCRWVYSVERVEPLAAAAERLLTELGYANVTIHVGDGSQGWKEHAPFDGILVTAGAPGVPPSLVDQLAMGGRLVIPIGDRTIQILYRVVREPGGIRRETTTGCVFVPLIGAEGWRIEREV